MALLHKATLTPSKAELMNAWLAGRPWLSAPGDARPVAAYRFDDPDGEVGIETALLQTTDGSVVQVPLTYRGAPLDVAEDALIGTTAHSVLGTRWVYDGCGDPVWATAFATAVLTGSTQAEQYFGSTGDVRCASRPPPSTAAGHPAPRCRRSTRSPPRRRPRHCGPGRGTRAGRGARGGRRHRGGADPDRPLGRQRPRPAGRRPPAG